VIITEDYLVRIFTKVQCPRNRNRD
jgi:hypothetical protein